VGTTCGVVNGSGPLQGTGNGAGTLPTPQIAVGGNYTCEFDGKFCGALTTDGSCAHGLVNTDTVTATLLGDEGEMVTQDTSLSSLMVHMCVTSSN
jgi:hypothetical protein